MGSGTAAMQRGRAGDIPLVWVEPAAAATRTLVVWLPGFSGTKEMMQPYLDLAAASFVGLSFDPFQHGERSIETRDQLRERVHGNIRRYFWPILAHTAEEVPQVLDWAVQHLGVAEAAGMGGISAGGDTSVVATAVDSRIAAVAAAIATPDWLRPGSFEPPGVPDAAAQACYERRNPLTNLAAYRHTPAISFQNGAEDRQVPPDGSQRFVAALREEVYAHCPERLEVVLHDGVAHEFTAAGWANALAWFRRHLAP